MDPERLRELQATYMDRGRLTPSCGSEWKTEEKGGETDTLEFNAGPIQFRIVTRSTFGIYQFLGKLLRQAKEGTAENVPPWVREDEVVPVLSTVREDHNLLTVVQGQGPDCFVHTYFEDGDYCVPEERSANTKRIFSLLAQLLALKTVSSDLAITPTVRTLPQ